MRLILFTGKGGVGKTTAAAATAALAAARGSKTLVVSTDAAHSLADAFGVELTGGPTELETGLCAVQVDPQRRFERSWREVSGYLGELLAASGVDPIQAEELTVFPGAEEVLALLAVREHVQTGIWDSIVVDCAPTGETLRLLALPEALGFYGGRLAPLGLRFLRSLRPVFTRASGVAAPSEAVFAGLARLAGQLREARDLLTGQDASVRLVCTPESVVIAETRRAFTTLSLYGYRADAVLVNRVFPRADADAWRASWIDAQAAQLAQVHASFAPLAVYQAPYQTGEPVGFPALEALGEAVYGAQDPLSAGPAGPLLRVRRDGAEFVLELALPLAARGEIDLGRRGDELLVSVGAHRRVLAMPSVLRRCEVVSAGYADGWLTVRFRPNPLQWPRAWLGGS
ncbi:MAG: ArsA family ATPase [Mycobacteriales bacterium]